MSQDIYLEILAPNERPSEFHLYLPADGKNGEFYTRYRFIYEVNAPDAELGYDEGPNNPANRKFWRIRTAHIVKKQGDRFIPIFRALSDGEIGFAILEQGAGDFCGGFHGDEVLTQVKLTADDKELPLDTPFFGKIESFSFFECSHIFRCNQPDTPILLHTQNYTADKGMLCVSQRLEWLSDANKVLHAFMPMLTVQRLNVDTPSEVLTDTVEFYGDGGTLLTSFDTTGHNADKIGEPSESVCRGTKATAVKVYGSHSGFVAEAGYTVRDDTIKAEQIDTSLCIRHMRNALDNKIYFDIGANTQPTKGDKWVSDVYYRIAFDPHKSTK